MPNGYAIDSTPAMVGNATLVIERENEVIAINMHEVREIVMSQEYNGNDEIIIRYDNRRHNMRIFPKDQVVLQQENESTEEV